jgi:hypothetical protein
MGGTIVGGQRGGQTGVKGTLGARIVGAYRRKDRGEKLAYAVRANVGFGPQDPNEEKGTDMRATASNDKCKTRTGYEISSKRKPANQEKKSKPSLDHSTPVHVSPFNTPTNSHMYTYTSENKTHRHET